MKRTTILRYESGARGYPHIVGAVINEGVPRAARGLKTLDMGHVTIELASAYDALPTGCGRLLNPSIAAMEAIQLIAGLAMPINDILRIAPQFSRYMDGDSDGEKAFFHGNYGQRIGYQMTCVERKLKRDPDTRQAVVTLWNPEKDNEYDRKDYPCTVALGFSINDEGALDMDVLMRSSDVWLGLPYDMFQFTQLQICLARALGIFAGSYRHTTWSLHIYEPDVEVARKIIHIPDRDRDRHSHVVGVGSTPDTMHDIMTRARRIMLQPQSMISGDLTLSERWYVERLFPPTDVG